MAEVVKTSPAIHVQIVPEHTGEQVASVLPEEIYGNFNCLTCILDTFVRNNIMVILKIV